MKIRCRRPWSRVGRKPSGERGLAVLVVLALLAIMTVVALSNVAALDSLERELQLIERRQQQRHEQAPGH